MALEDQLSAPRGPSCWLLSILSANMPPPGGFRVLPRGNGDCWASARFIPTAGSALQSPRPLGQSGGFPALQTSHVLRPAAELTLVDTSPWASGTRDGTALPAPCASASRPDATV